MTKLYKAAAPIATVNRIINIINRYGIPILEQTLGDSDMFCSCRISITHSEDTSIGTNGKGMNPLFARASGYAEFMERLQNRVIIYPNPASVNAPYRFFPDEKPYSWNKEETIENVLKFIPRVYPDNGLKVDRIDGMSLPFYHVNSKEVKDLPYSLIRWINGSNGMCAGNIPEEALVQGFNEIFERYCIQEMYRRKIVPPDVPISAFEGTEILRCLERMKTEYSMDYCIKDYSLGEGFPVIGLMVYSPDKQKYIMHFGADLNAQIALERCFTEIFQGYTAKTLQFENEVNTCERLDLFNEFKRSLMHGRGRLPKSYFTDTPSYTYQGHTTIPDGDDFRRDLNNICKWLIDKGYDIYIRNNSFMGFPTMHIVVPGMSEIDNNFCDFNRRVFHMQLTENNLNPLFRLGRLSQHECQKTIIYLESLDKESIDLFTRNNNPQNHVNRNLILMLLYIAIGQQAKAAEKIEAYKKEYQCRGKIIKPYFECLLSLLYGSSIPENPSRDWQIAIRLLANPQNALKLINAPDCFNCSECAVVAGCRYPLLKEIEDKVQSAMAANIINQAVLAEIFDVR